MGPRQRLPGAHRSLLLLAALLRVSHAAQGLNEASFPEDTESDPAGTPWWSDANLSDDEDMLADEASGDGNGSGENGSGITLPDMLLSTSRTPSVTLLSMAQPGAAGQPHLAGMTVADPDDEAPLIYFRALVNFTQSIDYSPRLDDANSEEFREVSEAVVDTLESEYYKIGGEQVVSVVFIKEIDGYTFVELDVGSEGNLDEGEIREVLYSVIESGSIASYITSTQGFQFRRLGAVPPDVRACTGEEFACSSGECIDKEFRCDRRPDCRDMSDELNCDPQEVVSSSPPPITTAQLATTRTPATTAWMPMVTTRRVPFTTPPRLITSRHPPVWHPLELHPCRRDEAVCSNKQCIPRDYLCDGERDCLDGSDELSCGTPTPCEPNEFKCRNGHCALKLWRCDGDNDCVDGSDEVDCPTKGPYDTCSPYQFSCVSSRTCIPASYQCDEEADCPDRSDEVGCTPPQVITPPEESVQATPGQTVHFHCVAVGVPTPIITWRLNWGHIPANRRVSISSENGHGTLTIRDVKEADQGAYTCEAINARGMVFGIPDGVLSLTPRRGPCPEGYFHVEGTSKCLACFCFGITTACHGTSRYRDQIRLRFDTPDDFKGVNVTTPAQPGMLPLSSTQLQIDPALQEFQLVDLSRRFLTHDSFWTLPSQFLGNKVDSYGGYLSFKVRYGLARGQSEPVQKSNVVIVGNGQKLIYRVQVPTQPSVVNQRQIHFTEENWQQESGAPVSREMLLLALQNLESILVQTIYDNKMASVGLSDIAMDTTTVELTSQGVAQGVEECRCPIGYSGLSCERCDARFERVREGPYLGTCSGCNCHGHSSSCDRVYGYCLNCQHNTEGPQCNKCKPGFFGDATRGNATACRPCPCPYTDPARRFSDTCFLDTDSQATCDACAQGYTGRRCESCARGYEGNPMQPGGSCMRTSQEIIQCDERGSSDSTGGACRCKPNVAGRLCNECTSGAFHLSEQNPDGCLKCFCMGVSQQCASSYWNREQVRALDGERAHFSLANLANTHTVSEGIRSPGHAELAFSAFNTLPRDVYYWVLPDRFKGDKVTSYGGELHYTVTHSAAPGAQPLPGQPDVLLRGNGIFLEHFAEAGPLPRTPTRFTVPFRERAWRRADGQDATREHLLMALADIDLFMIRASYMDRPAESRLSNIHMDVAVPHATGLERAVEVEECTCPPGYRGPSCQDCDVGYARTSSGLYLGTCERCDCSGHSGECDAETGDCQNCQDNTEGTRCERCQPGYYGDARQGTPTDCQPCPCHGPYATSQATKTCFLDMDGQPTCDACTTGYVGRQCQRCAAGYVGNPSLGQPCRELNRNCSCDPQGSVSRQCDASGQCQCKPHVEGPSCSSCRANHFHLSTENREGCLPCFCMGVTQQCTSSSYYRGLVTSPFLPGDFQNFALVNRQHSTRIVTGFAVELSAEGPQLSFGRFGQLGQESYYWQLPEPYQGDKRETYFARMRRAHKNGTSLMEEQLRKAVASGRILGSGGGSHRARQVAKPQWEALLRPRFQESSNLLSQGHRLAAAAEKYSLVYKGFSLLPESVFYWQLPGAFLGDKVGSYGGRLRYTLSYSSGGRSALLPDADVQITGNDITLVAYQPELLPRDRRSFEIIFREQYWKRPDGQHATREHLMMALADLDEILIRATYSTDMVSASIAGISMETAVPTYSSLPLALEVEECRCPPGYQGLSCQDCAAGYTRTGGGLYLGHCELCECNGHSDSCHPETGTCLNCLHNTAGEFCEQCAHGYYGDATTGTPEDCQPCACPLSEPENQFSRTCESLAGGGYRCSACEPGYTGQYCEQCAPGYVGNPSVRGQKCVPVDRAPFMVRVHPPKTTVSQGGEVTLRCQASGSPPYYYFWSREDGRPVPSTAQSRRQGEELHFPSIQPSEAGVYVCTCRSLQHSNASRAEVIVTEAPSKPITVTVEEKRVQSVKPGADVTFICTAKSKSPAYTLVWTRQNHGKLPRRAMDFNGILTIRNVQPEDAGVYVCTGSNMLDMAEGMATLHVQAPPKTQMFYGPIEVVEGHRPSATAVLPTATIEPAQLTVQPGQPAEFHCIASGSPPPTVEWIGGQAGVMSRKAVIQGGTLRFPAVEPSDEAEYLCRVRSSAGQHVARAFLQVHSASVPQVQVSPERTEVQEGSTVRLYCRAAGSPTATITWEKQGGSLPPQSRSERTDIATLVIPSITAADSGVYLCIGTSPAGVGSARIEVVVLRASGVVPPIRIEALSSSIAEGQTLDLKCLVTGQAPATVTWYKRGGSLPARHQVSGSHLRISQVSAADSGEYVCRVSIGASSREASIPVTVQHSASSPHAPPIHIESSSSAVTEGQSLDLKCLVTGQSPATVMWYKRGGSLPEGHQVSGSHLRLVRVSVADSGEYVCRVSTSAGIQEASIIVTIYRATGSPYSSGIEPPVRIESSSSSISEGQTLDLQCLVTGQAPATITWYKRGGSLPASHQVSGSYLRIPQVLAADAGEYVCRVSTGTMVQEASVIVTISSTGSSYSSGMRPPIWIEQSSSSVTEGQTLDLKCLVTGQTPATVTWYKRGGSLPADHQLSGSHLRLVQVSAADSGEYVCRAGTKEASVLVTIQQSSRISYPSGVIPPVRIESSSSSVAEGQTLDLNCLVAGQVQPRVTWHKRGGSLPASHQVSGSRLRIPQVSAADSGEYICRVSTGAITQETSLIVTIQGGAGSSYSLGVTPPVRIETSSASIAEGQTLDLNCMVAGQAQPRITWYRREGSLPASSQVSGSRLRIPQVSAADSGEYICHVSNGAGPLEASVIVTIPHSAGFLYPSGMAPPVQIESSSSSIAEGQTLDLNCLVAGQAQPRVMWYKRGGSLPASHQVSGSRLRIPQVSAADSGEYVCRVSTGAITQEAALVITIEDSTGPSYSSGMAPPIRIESSSSSIAEGQTLELQCLVAGQAPATVTWYKRGGSLPASHQVSGSRLRLVQVSAADSGEYVCRVSTSAGPREASITVSVPSGTSSSYRLQSPIISIEPHSTAVRQGEDATFKCRIHGGARPINITWKMAPKQHLQDNVKISPNGSVITISRARPSNQGAYRCVASNRYGVANSVVNLMVQGSPTVSVMPKGPVTVKAGKSISLDCLGMGDPRPLVRWSRLGMRQKLEHQKLLPLESQAVLQILAAKPEDAGTYICMAQNSIGSAQVQVEVSVEAANGKPGAPEITVKPTLTVVAGETATLQCSATGDPPPSIQWSKLRAPLPWQHRVVNNTLLIPRVAQQDSGQYICNASNAAGFTEAFVTLDVETPPYATILPEEVSVAAGEAVRLQCLAHGTPPLRYQWSKTNGSLSSNAVLRESALHISPTAPEDSGTYRCLVSNRVGSAETFAQVSVQGSAPSASPTVRVTPQTVVKGVGGMAEFTCSVTGDARARIEWFREGGELPASHSVRNGVLRIQNLDRGCQGVYTCRVSSPFGQAQDSARLVIQALPKVMINMRTSVQSVLVGTAVEFECLAIGDPKAHITWSKVGSRMRPEVVISGGMVKIEQVEQSDAGQYRCTATNDVGTVQSNIILHVQSIPQIAAQPEIKEVTTGSRAVFPCLASGFPVPEIKWTKLEGDLPKDICLENNVLTIPSVKPEDAGIYVCTASNRQGKVTAFSMLKVRERVVPYFTQNPQTFLALPTIKDAYKKFEIQITFRPDTADGMLLYNGQKKSTGADFVSFGLVGGRPEFRFDAGSGMATIRHPAPIRLGEFHTVRLYRNLTQGSLVLDSHPPVNGTSQGKFQGLDLNEELYLGGYPNYIAIAKSGLSSGFVGCVRQLLVQGEEVIFKDLDLKAHGVSNCPTCRDRPCQNGGVCRDSESSSYVCHCPQEFTGSNCEHSQALHCHPEACGPDATCINRADGQGYRCRCHLGKSGETCMEGVMATTPSFNGSDSFISYPPLTNIHYELRLDTEFKPLSPDGLIMFSGGTGAPVEDFVSLAMASGHVEFRYELGSGMAVLRSTEPLALGQWHKVSAERINKDGTLQVDSSKPVKRSSPGKSQGLNLRTPMYLGGVDKSVTLPAAASISSSFHGCIGEMSINGKKVDISYSFLESRGVTQCYDSSPCDRRPCLHGATCMPTGEYEFQCLCQDGFRGERCELSEDQCLLRNPCLNDGKCKANQCLCPAGFSGTYCEQGPVPAALDREWALEGSGGNDAPGQYGAYFQDGGYLALPQHVLPRSHPKSPETIELEVRTRSLNGLLLWQGVVTGQPALKPHATNEEEGQNGKAKDFISLGLRDGHLVFSYQLGSGEASIVSEDPINDGEWHRVTAIREGRRGSIQVDGEELVSGESPGSNVMVNTQGSVYIGGAPAIQALTAGKFRSGITGCLKNLVLSSEPGQPPRQPIDLQHHSEAGVNMQECPS
ncbi:basement membrane-specific heparan sulfate proteoglycan core protein isoform X2 [Gopherus flavomarginatus]|uniref:basement membrane-specific heparan sulfate proteoglycan core protein isoform X2 n=1 Tax=Gopherus flavomarginatus TaxID=286002 RepID=UPI0021CBB5FE|nr:basement membrane-specific heparan sulfate proteoglycan core protein isoform X2 [Gopherus flavomarginatus]